MMTHFAANAAAMLVSSIWQGAILAGLMALLLRLLPGTSASFRSVAWFVLFCAVCALHLIPAARQSAQAHVHPAPVWGVVVTLLWLGCSLLRAMQLGMGMRDLRRMLLRARPVADLVHAPDSKCRYQVCMSPDVDRPSVLGFFSPKILFPQHLLEALSPAELNQVLLHEREHLRRSDDWTNLFQKLALIVFPLNPVLLWVEKRLCVERELACDDVVVAATEARKGYAVCLTHLAEQTMLRRGFTLALGAWERKSELARRVERILSGPASQMTPSALRAGAAGILLFVGAGTAVLVHAPRLVSFTPEVKTTEMAGVMRQTAASPAISLNLVSAATPRRVSASQANLKRVGWTSAAKHRHQVARRTVYTPRKGEGNQLRGSLHLTEPRMVLTLASSDFVHPIYVPAVVRMPVAYAAVPTVDGWILIQL